MKKIATLLLSSLVSASLLTAQDHHCGSHLYLQQLEKSNPGITDQVRSLSQKQHYKSRASITYIPVVFHVVYNGSFQNINDDYLNAQIEQLNHCFLRTNSDTVNMRAVFQPIVGPAKIQFILDQIIRVPTVQQGFDAGGIDPFVYSDYVKSTANGGSSPIEPTKKLNIWVCDLKIDGSDGLIGYAYPPPGLPNWGGFGNTNPAIDGVVIDYLAVGGPAKQPLGFNLFGFRGKSLVHEVGHYLGLRHIWGDDGGACFGQFGFDDDGINDTPHQGDQSQFNCDKNINSCNEGANDKPDMVENYMDYSLESCQNSFTKGQVSLMEYVLENIRTTIKVPTSLIENDITSQIAIYPNPATNQINLSIGLPSYQQAHVTLSSVTGQLIHTHTLHGDKQYIIERNILPAGLYFIQLQIDNYTTISRKIILE